MELAGGFQPEIMEPQGTDRGYLSCYKLNSILQRCLCSQSYPWFTIVMECLYYHIWLAFQSTFLREWEPQSLVKYDRVRDKSIETSANMRKLAQFNGECIPSGHSSQREVPSHGHDFDDPSR